MNVSNLIYLNANRMIDWFDTMVLWVPEFATALRRSKEDLW